MEESANKHSNSETTSSIEDSGTNNNPDLLTGIVSRITYRNYDNGFGVIKVEASSSDGTLHTVIGTLPINVIEGSTIVARGIWNVHPKFGQQFKAYSITETKPTTEHALIQYLSSGIVKGIGPKTAERIVSHFSKDTLSILDNEPERLSEISGIGESKIEEFKAIWSKKKEEREVFIYFQNIGVSASVARKIYLKYGLKAIEEVKNNPYLLCRDIWGIGFLTADKIALKVGIEPDDKERLIAGLAHTIEEAALQGHTFLPREKLIKKAQSILQVDNKELLEKALTYACMYGMIQEHNESYYTTYLFKVERKAAECITNRIVLKNNIKNIPEHILNDVISKRHTGEELTTSIILSEEQKNAIKLAAESSILVITGGPGCGKTTVIKSIGSLFKKAGMDIRLAAPTGRAAQRLQEVCELPASTIHRLLKYDPIKQSFVHDESNLLPYDVLIIDESSMIDIPLAASLLQAISPKTRIIFVGDADQLPSVGPGLFFPDLLSINEIPKVELTRLFRRAEESSINTIAHQINKGLIPHIPEPDGSGKKDAYFLPINDHQEAASLIERLVSEQIPKQFNFNPKDITVLSPMNQGELGIISLNQRLQKKLIPETPGMPKVKMGSIEFKIGDRVCQRVNNYDIHSAGVFNGDQGTIFGIDSEAKSIYVKLWDGREVTYKSENISQLDLAYALTIHRSQGSEVPVIILVLHDSHAIMLERQLIYTGITRAKNLLIVIGTNSALKKSVTRIRSSKRHTGFINFIEELKSN